MKSKEWNQRKQWLNTFSKRMGIHQNLDHEIPYLIVNKLTRYEAQLYIQRNYRKENIIDRTVPPNDELIGLQESTSKVQFTIDYYNEIERKVLNNQIYLTYNKSINRRKPLWLVEHNHRVYQVDIVRRRIFARLLDQSQSTSPSFKKHFNKYAKSIGITKTYREWLAQEQPHTKFERMLVEHQGWEVFYEIYPDKGPIGSVNIKESPFISTLANWSW